MLRSTQQLSDQSWLDIEPDKEEDMEVQSHQKINTPLSMIALWNGLFQMGVVEGKSGVRPLSLDIQIKHD